MGCRVLWLLVAVMLLSGVPALAEPDDDVVLAEYESIRITQEDVERYIKFRLSSKQRQEVYSSPEQLLKIVQNLFMISYLASQVGEYDEAQLDWQMRYQRNSWLAGRAQDNVVRAALADVEWDAYAREVYIAETDKYLTKPKVDAAHILIEVGDRSPNDALELARSVRAKALAGQDFAALAKRYSEDPSVEKNNGNLGVFMAGQMVEEFSRAAFAMDEGEISEPIKTKFGYHVIKLNKKYPAARKPFDEVKDDIIREVSADMAAKTRERLVVEARSVTDVDINHDALQAMVTDNTKGQSQ